MEKTSQKVHTLWSTRKIQSASFGNWFKGGISPYYFWCPTWFRISECCSPKWGRETNMGIEKKVEAKRLTWMACFFHAVIIVRIVILVVRMEMKGLIREPFQNKTKEYPGLREWLDIAEQWERKKNQKHLLFVKWYRRHNTNTQKTKQTKNRCWRWGRS